MNYEIVGSPYPAVVCHLQQGEQMKTESGSMVWMDPAMTMETKGGGIGKMFGKAFTGESLFQNIYTATQPGKIAFASSFPGTIVPLQIGPGREFVVQKQSFLAGEAGVEISVHFNERIGSGFFGGEGFIMQRLSGQGMAFVEVDGSLVQYELAPGQQLIVDTGNVMGFSLGVDIRIQRVKGAKNIFLGGEGLPHRAHRPGRRLAADHAARWIRRQHSSVFRVEQLVRLRGRRGARAPRAARPPPAQDLQVACRTCRSRRVFGRERESEAGTADRAP